MNVRREACGCSERESGTSRGGEERRERMGQAVEDPVGLDPEGSGGQQRAVGRGGRGGARVLTGALWWLWWGDQAAEESRSQGQEGDGGTAG